jgi:hypothetical protein
MGPALFANNATTTLAAAINTTATTITVANGAGALFPSITSPQFFYATLVNASNTIEIVQVTARSGDTMTVVRGAEGTTPSAYNIGDKFELRITAGGLSDKLSRSEAFSIAESQVTGLVSDLASIRAGLLPAGTTTVFYQAAAPTGWTQKTTQNDIIMRVVSGTGGGGYTSGQSLSAATVYGSVVGHSLTQSELPNYTLPINDPGHAHLMGGSQVVASGASFYDKASNIGTGSYTGGAGTGITVYSGGGNAAHGHGFSGSPFNLNYIDMILCTKN